jgi:hypothetical protein
MTNNKKALVVRVQFGMLGNRIVPHGYEGNRLSRMITFKTMESTTDTLIVYKFRNV